MNNPAYNLVKDFSDSVKLKNRHGIEIPVCFIDIEGEPADMAKASLMEHGIADWFNQDNVQVFINEYFKFYERLKGTHRYDELKTIEDVYDYYMYRKFHHVLEVANHDVQNNLNVRLVELVKKVNIREYKAIKFINVYTSDGKVNKEESTVKIYEVDDTLRYGYRITELNYKEFEKIANAFGLASSKEN